jgi:hypothetical protein
MLKKAGAQNFWRLKALGLGFVGGLEQAKSQRRDSAVILELIKDVLPRPGFAPPRGAKFQNLHRTSRGAGADFRTLTDPEGREGRWRVTLIDPHEPAFA